MITKAIEVLGAEHLTLKERLTFADFIAAKFDWPIGGDTYTTWFADGSSIIFVIDGDLQPTEALAVQP